MSGLHFTRLRWNASYDALNRAVSMADTQEQAESQLWGQAGQLWGQTGIRD